MFQKTTIPKIIALTAIILHFQADLVSSKNIVVWQVIGTFSTRISMTPLMEELAERGHDVTLVSIFPSMDNTTLRHKTVVPKKWLAATGTSWDDSLKLFDIRKMPWNVPKLWYDILDIGLAACQLVCEDEEFISWAKGTKVDMVIIESVANDCAYGFAHFWNAKIVMYGTSTVTPYMIDAYGLADESSSVADTSFGFASSKKSPMAFWQRFLSEINPIIYYTWRKWTHLPKMEEMTSNALGIRKENMPKFVDIEKNTSVVLLTTHYSFGETRSFPPNVIPVGGAVVSKKLKPLPKDMEKFIESAENGFIYISFGTAVEFTSFDEHVQIEFIAALKEFPKMKFVWKSSQPIKYPVPSNVFVAKWAPQQTLLGHPKIKAFISHMGMGSTTETIHHAVPVISFPVCCDQDMNAEVISDRNAGIKLEILDLKRDQFAWAIKEILNNPKYREGMKRLSSIYNDRPRPALEEAVWWVEYAIRHDDIHEILMPVSAHQSWWKRRQLDVWFAAGFIILALVTLPVFILKVVMKKIFTTSGNTVQKKVKSS